MSPVPEEHRPGPVVVEPSEAQVLADDAIPELVRRLARPHASGGHVIERATLVAEGSGSAAIITWIVDHAGQPEFAQAPTSRGGGLHGDRRSVADASRGPKPLRYVLPPGALA
ncbi:MAG: hypothetical protein ACR2LK_11710 [Solirubrobacteraceae bacterium]